MEMMKIYPQEEKPCTYYPHLYAYKLVKSANEVGSMRDYILERVLDVSYYIVENQATVRQTARKFGVSKSTVHKDVTERLPQINRGLSFDVRKVLGINKAERHLRGGEATRKKYKDHLQKSKKTAGDSPKKENYITA